MRPLVGVANPLSAKFDTLRPSLLPGLVDAVAHNRRHGRRDVALFEIGARFTADGRNARRRAGVDRIGGARALVRRRRARWISSTSRASSSSCAARSASMCAFEPAAAPFLVAGQAAAVLESAIVGSASSASRA